MQKRSADAAPLGNGGAEKRAFGGSGKRWPVAEDCRGGVGGQMCEPVWGSGIGIGKWY